MLMLGYLDPLSAHPTKWSNTLIQFVGNLPTKFLSVFEHFVGLVCKGLRFYSRRTSILIYINDLSEHFHYVRKLFADSTLLFSAIEKVETAASDLNNDVKGNEKRTSIPSKQIQEVLFGRKVVKTTHFQIFFNNISVFKVDYQKRLRLILNFKYNFPVFTFGNHGSNENEAMLRKFTSDKTKYQVTL